MLNVNQHSWLSAKDRTLADKVRIEIGELLEKLK